MNPLSLRKGQHILMEMSVFVYLSQTDRDTGTHVHKGNQPQASGPKHLCVFVYLSQTDRHAQSTKPTNHEPQVPNTCERSPFKDNDTLLSMGGQSDHCDWPEEAACPHCHL